MGKSIAGGEGPKPPRLEPIEAAAHRADPQTSFAVLEEEAHGIIGKTSVRGDGSEASVAKAAQPATGRANPEIARARLKQFPNAAEELARLLRINRHDAVAQATHVAVRSAKP